MNNSDNSSNRHRDPSKTGHAGRGPRNSTPPGPPADGRSQRNSAAPQPQAQSQPENRQPENRASGSSVQWAPTPPIFHTVIRLADSLTGEAVKGFDAERAEVLARPELTPVERQNAQRLPSLRIEEFLDAGHGSCLMKDRHIAYMVMAAFRRFDGERYRLHAVCVMPNHVHAVLQPLPGHPLPKIIESLKSFTGREMNRLTGTKRSLWQNESFDQPLRTEAAYALAIRNVLQNPAKANLGQWLWVYSPNEMPKEPEPSENPAHHDPEPPKRAPRKRY